jgi:hypothetical protein
MKEDHERMRLGLPMPIILVVAFRWDAIGCNIPFRSRPAGSVGNEQGWRSSKGWEGGLQILHDPDARILVQVERSLSASLPLNHNCWHDFAMIEHLQLVQTQHFCDASA